MTTKAKSTETIHHSDAADLPVLIIGAGLAGLTVALDLAKTQKVVLMAKRGLSESATAWAQGGIVGVVDKEHDSIDAHVSDTLNAGAGLVVGFTPGNDHVVRDLPASHLRPQCCR